MTDRKDLVIFWVDGNWISSDHIVDAHDSSVVFINTAEDEDCRVIFADPNTFGTSGIGIYAGGVVSLNVLKRETTVYWVQDWDDDSEVTERTGQHTIEVNNTGVAHRRHQTAKT